jgi:hypothetical protein
MRLPAIIDSRPALERAVDEPPTLDAWFWSSANSMSRLSSLPYLVVRRASSLARPYLRTTSAVSVTTSVLRLIWQ